MNPVIYLKAFAWLSLIALACTVLSEFWLPMLLGAAALAVLVRIAR